MFNKTTKKIILAQRAFAIGEGARNIEVISDHCKMSRKNVWQLAREGNVTEIQNLLDSSEDSQKIVNQLDTKNLSPLHYATKYLHLEMIKMLILNYGANVDIQGEDNMTPLHFVSRYGSDECGPVVKCLLDQGADVNACDIYGLTALHFCAIRGNLRACLILFSSPDIVKKPLELQNCTPLHLAATYSQVEVAKILLEEDISSKDHPSNDSRLPIHDACQAGCFEIVELILNSKTTDDYPLKQIDLGDISGETPLSLAVNIGSLEIVKILLENNANPSIPDFSHTYPLHDAAKSGNVEIIKILLEHMKMDDIKNCTNLLGETPLHFAAFRNKVDAIELLCSEEYEADIDVLTHNQETPLMYAVEEGSVEATLYLLEMKANINLCNNNGQSVLHIGARENQLEILKMIFDECISETDALLNTLDIYENTALHIAAKEGHHEIVEFFLNIFSERSQLGVPQLVSSLKNDSEMTPLHLATKKGRLDVVKQLINYEKNLVLCIDENNDTALHLACLHKKPKIAEELLKHGGSVMERNSKQWTPLDCASSVGAIDCAKILFTYDSPLNPEDRAKSTPLHLSVENGHVEMVNLLLENGADISKEDHQNRNPLEKALLHGQRDCVEKILQHEKWIQAMRTSHPIKNHRGDIIVETPMRLLIRYHPDLAEVVLQKCIIPLNNFSSKFELDYEFLEDTFFFQPSNNCDDNNLELKEEGDDTVDFLKYNFNYAKIDEQGKCIKYDQAYNNNATTVMLNHPLMIIANDKKHLGLLKHPLCLALVRKKWNDFGRYFYYIILVGYIMFLTFLTYFGISVSKSYRNSNSSNDNFCILKSENYMDSQLPDLAEASGMFIIIFSMVFMIFEIIQLIRHGIRYWSWSNLLDWIVYSLSIITVTMHAIDIEQDPECTLQWQLMAVLLTLAWLNLLSYLRHLVFGIYIMMFVEILKTFSQFAMIFVIFIVAFGLGFHFLLINQTSFEYVRYTMLKTSGMMIGEIDYNEIFLNKDYHDPMLFPFTTWCFYAIFLIVMPIIIMNLLVGLAVDDIKIIQEKATLKRLAMDVEFVLDIQRLLPIRFLQKNLVQIEEITSKPKWWQKIKLFDFFLKKYGIINAIKNETSDGESSTEKNIESLKENIKQLTNEMKSLAKHTRDNKVMLNELVKRMINEDMDEM